MDESLEEVPQSRIEAGSNPPGCRRGCSRPLEPETEERSAAQLSSLARSEL